MLASKRFTSLDTNSSIQGQNLVDNCPVDMPSALCPLKYQPFGQDPSFNPFSDIFDEDLPGLDGNYYNITTVSTTGSGRDTQLCCADTRSEWDSDSCARPDLQLAVANTSPMLSCIAMTGSSIRQFRYPGFTCVFACML